MAHSIVEEERFGLATFFTSFELQSARRILGLLNSKGMAESL